LNFSVCDLSGLQWSYVDLTNASLIGATVNQTYFDYANLNGANLAGLFEGIHTPANFYGASLYKANLSFGSFENAGFEYTDLVGANLNSADFTNANMTGANLTGAENVLGTTWTGVIWNGTECPDGTNSNNDSGTCINDM
jgi:uncharacterized protein YjbI with pentapeptide repeats